MGVLKTTAGQFAINEMLPQEMRDYSRTMDGKTISALMREIAEKYPERYRDISFKLNKMGINFAYRSGGNTFGLKDLRAGPKTQELREEIRKELKAILADDNLGEEERNEAIIKRLQPYGKKLEQTVFEEAKAAGNPLATQIVSGARGKPMNLNSLLGADLFYSDHRGNTIPVPVLSSFASGLKPYEYWAGTYGTRMGVISTKFATADAGYLAKQLNQVAHRLVVTDEDEDEEEAKLRAEQMRGYPVSLDDPDNEGTLLAKDVGPFKRNTVLTPKVIKALREAGHEDVLIRSPITGASRDGGVFARDVGVREFGRLPERGSMVGLTAAQALSEPLTQGLLNVKHQGGVAGASGASSGFDYINSLVQIPKKFKSGATHAEADGIVDRIEEAPAGGHLVFIDGKEHYVPAKLPLKVKQGDEIEAGDVISEGAPHPATIVKYKGVGEGRRYFVDAFRDAYKNSGLKVHRRNVELLARGLINHVKLNAEVGSYVPDDTVAYDLIEREYKPRDGHELLPIERAKGRYLEQPVLHYSIGTPVRPSVIKMLKKYGVQHVDVHHEAPPFEPEMIRGLYSVQNDEDWMTRMYGSGLKDSLLDSAHRGRMSDPDGTSFVPSLAQSVNFGKSKYIQRPVAPDIASGRADPVREAIETARPGLVEDDADEWTKHSVDLLAEPTWLKQALDGEQHGPKGTGQSSPLAAATPPPVTGPAPTNAAPTAPAAGGAGNVPDYTQQQPTNAAAMQSQPPDADQLRELNANAGQLFQQFQQQVQPALPQEMQQLVQQLQPAAAGAVKQMLPQADLQPQQPWWSKESIQEQMQRRQQTEASEVNVPKELAKGVAGMVLPWNPITGHGSPTSGFQGGGVEVMSNPLVGAAVFGPRALLGFTSPLRWAARKVAPQFTARMGERYAGTAMGRMGQRFAGTAAGRFFNGPGLLQNTTAAVRGGAAAGSATAGTAGALGAAGLSLYGGYAVVQGVKDFYDLYHGRVNLNERAKEQAGMSYSDQVLENLTNPGLAAAQMVQQGTRGAGEMASALSESNKLNEKTKVVQQKAHSQEQQMHQKTISELAAKKQLTPEETKRLTYARWALNKIKNTSTDSRSWYNPLSWF